MVLLKNMPWCKIIGISLTLERSDAHGYRYEAWSAELMGVGVVVRAGYNMEENLRVIYTEPTVNP